LNLFPLETAVHKMTGLTASTFGLAGRGVLKEGCAADIVAVRCRHGRRRRELRAADPAGEGHRHRDRQRRDRLARGEAHRRAPGARASAQCDPLRRGHAREVLFGFDRAELDGEGRKRLDDLAQALLGSAFPRSVLIIGHADRLGSAAYNEQLSARRAQAVRDALIEKGVPARLLRVHSKGDSVPLTAGRCGAVGGAEAKQTLIACLQPDRRAEIELAAP
jgi:outer membrane protein OmpA-like peptidoglycan-associated protein